MEENKLAIFVSTYNQVDSTLPNCLLFIQEQTYKDFICVVGDDQSTDNTREVVEKFCKEDKRFNYHLTPTKYVRNSKFYNWAAKNYPCKYMITCDGDNYLADECAERRLAAIEMSDCVAVYSQCKVLDYNEAKDKVINQYVRAREWNLNDYVFGTSYNNWIDMCDLIFLHQAYMDVGGYFEKGHTCQDYSIMVRLAMKFNNRIGYLPEILAQYNSFTDGQMRTKDATFEAHKNIFSDDPKDWQL